MINWIVFFFLILGMFSEDLFDIFIMFYVNLPIIASARLIYVLVYILNYFKDFERKDDGGKYVFSKKEKLYFLGKNIAVILLGFLNLYIAVFFALYSLLCAATYFKNMGGRKNNIDYLKLGKVIYGLSPIGFVIYGLWLMDFFIMLPVTLSLLLFFYWGNKYANLSKEELYQRYQRRVFKRIPLAVQITIILILIVPSLFIFGGLYLFGIYFFVYLTPIVDYVFNPLLIIVINLPIVILARIFLLHSTKTDCEEKLKLSKRRKIYFITKNLTLILIGFLIIFIALFIVVYSCLIAGAHYNKKKKISFWLRENTIFYVNSKILSIFSYLLIVISFLAAIIFYFDIVGFIYMGIAGGIAVLLYIFKGKKYANFSFEELSRNISQRFNRTPKLLKYFLIFYLIVVPLGIILGTYTLGTPRKETYMVRMRDGTELATDVYYSPLVGKNPAPVILIRTPYGKDGFSNFYTNLYLPQGYHCVVQDFRGCHDSGIDEDFLLFTKAYTDGVDTINWIMDKKWCNGKIGSAGVSALAINQYFYAGMEDVYNGDDGLRCQSLWFGCPDLYLDAIMEGAYHESSVETWVKSTADINWRYQINTILDLIESQNINSELYNATTLLQGENIFENVQARAIHCGGWYDHFISGTIRGFMGYDDEGGKRARDHQLLVIGPWTHGAVIGMQQGELLYPSSSNGIPLLLDWEIKLFEESLLGIEHDELWEGNRVAYYLMGDVDDPEVDANYWKFVKDWPLNYKVEEWYLGIDKEGDKVIVQEVDDLIGFKNITYNYDPADPVLTRGGNNQPGFDTAGPMDQRVVEEKDGKLRDDILLFQSETLKKPVTFEGNLAARLHIKSSCNDTDFMVKLCDVYPDGRRMLIIDAALTTRFRNGFFAEEFIEPGKEYNITIDLWATAYQFNVGHKIAITITSSNYDRFAINPNTGGPIGKVHYSSGKIAENTLITGPGKSCILFPVLKE
ncbi:MAG: CocE/NonD family hydrolase [Promethearchaeota archaeon]